MVKTTLFPPIDDQSIIWRFIDFTKFVSLLETESLFFCRLDKLGDPFEGSIPAKTLQDFEKEYYRGEILQGKLGYEKMKKQLQVSSLLREVSREWFYVNCWHMNDYESAAMWSLYTHPDQAVSIRSTVKSFRDSLPPEFRGNKIFIEPVQYVDFENEIIPVDEFMERRLLYKRKSFEHEQEIRAFFNINFRYDKPAETGFLIKAKLSILIDSIYVGPSSPDGFLDLVRNVSKKYGIDKIPERTSLDNKALF